MPARLKDLRTSRGLSIRDLAEKVGVSPPSIFQWERQTRPRGRYIAALAEALLVSPAYLEFGGREGDPVGEKIERAVAEAKRLIARRTGISIGQIAIKVQHIGQTDT